MLLKFYVQNRCMKLPEEAQVGSDIYLLEDIKQGNLACTFNKRLLENMKIFFFSYYILHQQYFALLIFELEKENHVFLIIYSSST